MRPTRLFAAALLSTASMSPIAYASQTIVLASTTSVENSGLLARILPMFTAATGIEVRVIALGTGQALAVAARGDADLVLVHDPDAEAKFMAAGHGMQRVQVAWNDFVLLGPVADPAHVAGGRDAAAALAAIRAASAPFVSRGDASGTDAEEHRLWKETGTTPMPALDDWYRSIGGGMGAALNTASAMGAYTLSDRGTWLAYKDKSALKVVVEGDPRLVNRYDVITLNPAEHDPATADPARTLANWLASAKGQAAIGSLEMGGERLFHTMAEREP